MPLSVALCDILCTNMNMIVWLSNVIYCKYSVVFFINVKYENYCAPKCTFCLIESALLAEEVCTKQKTIRVKKKK